MSKLFNLRIKQKVNLEKCFMFHITRVFGLYHRLKPFYVLTFILTSVFASGKVRMFDPKCLINSLVEETQLFCDTNSVVISSYETTISYLRQELCLVTSNLFSLRYIVRSSLVWPMQNPNYNDSI